jgi:hypothetical protein
MLQMKTCTTYLALLLLVWSTTTSAASYCSLKVIVVNPEGIEVEAAVRVTEPNGRILEQENKLGGIEFCDLGVSPVTVAVGSEAACNAVTVRNVKLRWRVTSVVKVIYDREACIQHPPPDPVPLCKILLRIADAQKHWLSGAQVKVSTPFQHTYTADEYGRVMLRSEYGPDLQGVVNLAGYSPKEFKFPCSLNHFQEEHHLVLEKEAK